MGTFGGFLRLIRPVNCVMMGFTVLVGATIGSGADIIRSWQGLILGFTTGFTLTGSAMAVNDYYDREIDAINEPSRPIPSGAVTPRGALTASLVLSVVGLLTAWLTSLINLAVAVFSWTITVLYVTKGKQTGLFGNLLVSTCIATPFIYGGFIIESNLSTSFLLFALMAFLSNTGREVTKGIVDMAGDRALGINTVAVSKGVSTAALVSTFCYLLAVAVSFAPPFFKMVSLWYVPFIAFTDLGLIYLSLSLVRDPSRENSKKVKNRVLLLMMSGLIGFLAGSLL